MIFNIAFNTTAKQLRTSWPIIEVDDNEFVNFSIPESYKTANYVWVVNKKYKTTLLETFDWSYAPVNHVESVHLFPICFDDTKNPINWNAVKLVPTMLSPVESVKSNIISGYINTPFYYTIYERGLINKVISKSPDMRYRVAKTKPSFDDMLKSYSFKNYNKDYILFVDVDVSLDSLYNFKTPKLEDGFKIYHYSVKHVSSGLSYADNSVVFVPYEYIQSLQNNNPITVEHVIVDDVVGELNDLFDPEFAWARSYSTTGLILQNKFFYKQRNITNKILTSFLSSTGKLSNYVVDGCSQASKDIENNIDIDFTNFKEISKRFLECVNKSAINADNLKPMLSKLEMVKRVYGEDSEQYKNMLAKLESI